MSDNQKNNSSNALLLEAKNIAYQKRDKKILNDVSLSLRSKEIITLIGPKRCG